MTRIILTVLLVVLCFATEAQRSYIFNRLSQVNGLNTNKINCIWQDQKGFLWIGTENAIQRFDGRKFIRFSNNGKLNSMPPNSVDQILEADEGKMWIRQGNQIGLFDPVSYSYSKVSIDKPDVLPDQSELNLFRDSKGNTFLCTHKTGLLHYDKAENKFTGDNLPVRVPESWTVNSLYEDTVSGDYWICSDSGLAVFHPETQALSYPFKKSQNKSFFDQRDLTFVYRFFVDKNRTWWIIRWDYSAEIEPVLLHYDPFKHKILEDIAAIQKSGTEYIGPFWLDQTSKGQIWFGGVNTLVCFDTKLNTFIQNRKANPGEYDIKCREIKQMYEDRENNLWFSTDNGLYVVATEQKSVYNVEFEDQNQKKDQIVNAIQETKDMENWIGTWGNGILIFDEHFKEVSVDLYQSIKGSKAANYKQVWDLYQHSKSGLMWSGCQNGQLAIFDTKARKPVYLLEPPVFEHAPIRQILEDKNGNLFFGTQKGRIVKWNYATDINNTNFEIIRDFNSSVYRLYRDKSDRIWIGTRNAGLFVMDSTGKNVLYQYREQPGLSTFKGSSVYDIVQYNDSIFFVSTGFLNIINLVSGKVKALTHFDGLPGANVTQLLTDDENILWFTHNNGLGSYNYRKQIFNSYNERNGIIMAEQPAYTKFRMKNGELWFGGDNSLFGFIPEELKLKSAPPDVTLTDFKIFNQFIPLDSLISSKKNKLEPDQNSFTIYFASLSFTQQNKLFYYYKLDGVDDDWVKAEEDRAANYTTLSPGKYTFNVKCVNMQGIESANITSLPITILPHFYQTWWFISLSLLAAGLLTYWMYRMRLTKLLAVERIRNKVARDLHDDVGSTLSTINILSTMAKTKLMADPVKTSEYISKITHNSQHMMEAMDDIVWSIKPDNDNMHRIIARMREYSSAILEPKNIEISFHIDEHIYDLKLNMEIRRDMFLIFKEAINNVAKYAHCTKVYVLLILENKRFLMNITDNGVGFNVGSADSGNGLGNMQKRAESLRGTIKIISFEGQGTEIELIFPF